MRAVFHEEDDARAVVARLRADGFEVLEGEWEPGAKRERIVLRGDVPSPSNPPSGCPFHPRCQHPLKDADCADIVPPLAEKAAGHFAACIKEPAFVRIEDQRARNDVPTRS